MDDDRQSIDLNELWHPSTPSPMLDLYGYPIADLPPRRTVRERVRALMERLGLRRPTA